MNPLNRMGMLIAFILLACVCGFAQNSTRKQPEQKERQIWIRLKSGEVLSGNLVRMDATSVDFTVKGILQSVPCDNLIGVMFIPPTPRPTPTPAPVATPTPTPVPAPVRLQEQQPIVRSQQTPDNAFVTVHSHLSSFLVANIKRRNLVTACEIFTFVAASQHMVERSASISPMRKATRTWLMAKSFFLFIQLRKSQKGNSMCR